MSHRVDRRAGLGEGTTSTVARLIGSMVLVLASSAATAQAAKRLEVAGHAAARFVQVSVTIQPDGYDTCAVREDGALACVDGYVSNFAVPKGRDFTQVSVGSGDSNDYGCALRRDHSIVCWPPDPSNPYTITHVPAGRFTQISAGPAYACAVRVGGKVSCWGNYPNPTPRVKGRFTQVSVGGGTDPEFQGGTFFGCGVRRDGSIACWGQDGNWKPMHIPGVPRGRFLQVNADFVGICGLRVDRTIVCWDGGYEPASFGPAKYRYTEVSGHCGLRINHTIYCGANGNMLPGHRFKQFSAGEYDILCGVQLDGTLYCA